jgi:hypothetical protein
MIRLKDLIEVIINELDFTTQNAFDTYQDQHDMRGDTKVTVAGKSMNVVQAIQQSKNPNLKNKYKIDNSGKSKLNKLWNKLTGNDNDMERSPEFQKQKDDELKAKEKKINQKISMYRNNIEPAEDAIRKMFEKDPNFGDSYQHDFKSIGGGLDDIPNGFEVRKDYGWKKGLNLDQSVSVNADYNKGTIDVYNTKNAMTAKPSIENKKTFKVGDIKGVTDYFNQLFNDKNVMTGKGEYYNDMPQTANPALYNFDKDMGKMFGNKSVKKESKIIKLKDLIKKR